MTIAVAYKWAANPQDATVASDGVVDWSRAKLALSEYDPVAIQLGRAVADATGSEVIGLSVGTTAVAGSMAKKSAMSRGLDRGLVIADDEAASWNLTKVAGALAELVNQAGSVDLVLTGDASVDENAKMISALLAGHLGWPCFQVATAVAKTPEGWTITQEIPGGTRTVDVAGPAVVAVTTDAIAVKVPGMKDILAAGKKPVDTVTAVGLPEDALTVTGRSKPASRARKNLILPDAAALAAALRNDGVL